VISYPKEILKKVLDYLKEQEQELLKRARGIKAGDPFKDGNNRVNESTSDEDEAVDQYEHVEAEALGKETKQALERVRTARERIDEGTYGKCLCCGEMIDTDRLAVDPTVEFCIDCAKQKKN